VTQTVLKKNYRFKLNKKNTELVLNLLKEQQADDISFYLDMLFELIAEIQSYDSERKPFDESYYYRMLSKTFNNQKYNKPLHKINFSQLKIIIDNLFAVHGSYNAYLLSTIFPKYLIDGLSDEEALDRSLKEIGIK